MKTLVHDGMTAEQAMLVGIVEHHIDQSKMRALEAALADAQSELTKTQEIAIRNINRAAHLERERDEAAE
jgi:hypothetical protein